MAGIDECLLEAMTLPGARGAALVEWISGLSLGAIGEAPDGDHEAMAAHTAEFARYAAEHPVFTADPRVAGKAAGQGSTARSQEVSDPPGAVDAVDAADAADAADPDAAADTGGAVGAARPGGPPIEDVVVVTRVHYHLLRFLEAPYEGGVFLHLWLDRTEANLALALLRLRLLAERLVLE